MNITTVTASVYLTDDGIALLCGIF